MVTPNEGNFQNAFATPDNGNFDAAMDAFYLQQSTADAVALSVKVSENADPHVRLRVAQEVLLRHRRNPR